MPVPIMKQGDYLIASIQSALTDVDLLKFQSSLSEMVGRHHTRGVIIDVTILDVIDSFAARTVRAIAYALKLRGADTVIVGIQPEVAFSMVQLGLSLEGVMTALDLDDGLELLSQRGKDEHRE